MESAVAAMPVRSVGRMQTSCSGRSAATKLFPSRISSSVGWSHAKSAIVKRSSAIGWASARRSSHQCRLAVLASSSALPAANLPQGPQSRLAHAFLGFMAVVWQKLTAAVQVASQQVRQQDTSVINTGIKQSVRHFHMLGMVAPFAAASSGGATTFLLLTKAMARFIKIYLLFLFLRVLLSWFPAFNWDRQPWLALRQMTDPYLNLYRGLVPPLLGTIDFTPLLGFFILQYLSGVLESGSAEDEIEEYW